MKWFSYKTMVTHKNDLKVQRDTELNRILPFVSQIANTFSRDANAVGILDINDLIQSGYVGLISAWSKVDWDMIEASENPQGKLWSYLKKRIRGTIRRDIDKYASFVARPINQQEAMRSKLDPKGVDKVLVSVFPSFFDNYRFMKASEFDTTPYTGVLLERLIDDALEEYVFNVDHRDILKRFYGIGFDKMSTKELADHYNKLPNAITQTIYTTRNKLKTKEFEKKIENFYENL